MEVPITRTVVNRKALHAMVERGGLVKFFGVGLGVKITALDDSDSCVVEIFAHDSHGDRGFRYTKLPTNPNGRKTTKVNGEVMI